MCKILELCDQNPWRNNLSKLGTFDSILQRPHSALLSSYLITVVAAVHHQRVAETLNNWTLSLAEALGSISGENCSKEFLILIKLIYDLDQIDFRS